MRRIPLLCLPVLLVALALPAAAQGILPASVAGWNASSPQASEDLGQIAGSAAPALKEYEVQSAESRAYSHGADSLTVAVYTFKSTAGAYGAYSFLRTPDMAQANLTQHSSMSSDRALALTGNLVVQFNGKSLRKDDDAIVLLVAMAGGHAHFGRYPALPQQLPTENFVPRSDHFVLGPVALNQFLPLASGDWLNLSAKGAEGEIGRYRLGSHDATLVLVDYPTPQLAEAQMRQLQTQLRVATLDDKGAVAEPGSAASPLYARRDSTMVALLAGAPSAKAAGFVLGKVQSGLVLTWNMEVVEKPQPTMVTIVIGTFVGAGEICAFTLLGGLIFAGIRLLIKRMWPGQIFDRALDMEILELGLGSRPIKGNDLYQMRPRT